MLRVVLDTNTLVSALLKPSSAPRGVLKLGLAEAFRIVVSDSVSAEYELVLPRPELKLSPKEVAETLDELRRCALWVSPTRAVSAAPDDDDNRFLECAEAAHAGYLVTGNKWHFPPRWKSTHIVNAREFLEMFTPRP